jgi:hypothetical protein
VSDHNLIADLARAGLDPELLQRVVVVIASCQAEREAAERRRALDRARKAFTIVPDIPQNSAESKELHGTVGIPAAPPSRAPLTSYSSLLTEKKEESKEVRKKEARGRSLPPDWHPSQSHYDTAAGKGRPRAFVDQCAVAMRDWALANSNRAIARKADWDRTFNGWLDRELAKGGQNGFQKDRSTTAAGRRLVAELREQERERDAMGTVLALPSRRAGDDPDGLLQAGRGSGSRDFHSGGDRDAGAVPGGNSPEGDAPGLWPAIKA